MEPAFPEIGNCDNYAGDPLFENEYMTPNKRDYIFGGENSNRGMGGGIFDDLEDNGFDNCDNNYLHEDDVMDNHDYLLSPANGAIQGVDVVNLDDDFVNLKPPELN